MEEIDLKQAMFDIVDKQVTENEPKIVKQTMTRLSSLGYDIPAARIKIAAVLAEQMYDSMQTGTFDGAGYSRKLTDLK
ncbi:MAG: hypothetical protein ACRC6X_02000 [Culicoidibacterales bacterium]